MDSSVCESLICEREINNPEDPFAVAMLKEQSVVGHIPRKISAACSLFLSKEGMYHHWKEAAFMGSSTRWPRGTF